MVMAFCLPVAFSAQDQISDKTITEPSQEVTIKAAQSTPEDQVIVVQIPEIKISSNDQTTALDKFDTLGTWISIVVAALTILFGIVFAVQIYVSWKGWSTLKEYLKEAQQTLADAKLAADETKTACDEAAANRDEAVNALAELKPILRRIRKIEEEVNEYRKTIIVPNLSDILSEEEKAKLDDYSEAVTEADKLGIELTYEDYFAQCADFYYKKNYEEALAFIEKAIKLKPEHAVAWNNKGVILGRLKKYEKALKAFNKAIEFKPDYADALDNKGVVLSEQKLHKEALVFYNKAIELNPHNPNTWNNKGVSFVHLGELDKALELFNKALKINPEFAGAYYNIAWVKDKKGEKEQALKKLAKAIELDISMKDYAKTDEDFKSLWDDDDFKKLIE